MIRRTLFIFLFGGETVYGNKSLKFYKCRVAERSNSKAEVYRDKHIFHNNCCD